jgi:hypothetical protein
MAANTKVIIRMAISMEKENLRTPTDRHTMACGKMARSTEKESGRKEKGKSARVSGKMTKTLSGSSDSFISI